MKMSIILFLNLLLSVFLGCTKPLQVYVREDDRENIYSVSLEEGIYLAEGAKQKICLRFYNGNYLFTKDTDERIHIYLTLDRLDTTCYFVRVKGRPASGYLKIYQLALQTDKGMIKKVKAVLESPSGVNIGIIEKISFSFDYISLKEVYNKMSLVKNDNEYFQNTVAKLYRYW